jgi:hypothetical protein
MKIRWIDNYAGTWGDGEGRTLIITPRSDTTADVTLLVDGQPMFRPWCRNKPAKGLRATYSPADGPGLDIELGRPGFSLNVNYEFVDPNLPKEPESLSVDVSRYESDAVAEAFVRLFGKLELYKKIDLEKVTDIDNP